MGVSIFFVTTYDIMNIIKGGSTVRPEMVTIEDRE